MKLWIVIDNARWGFSHNVVRAETAEDAARLVDALHPSNVSVEELSAEGPAAVVWCYDESPDSPRD